jgi:hypothetical protein
MGDRPAVGSPHIAYPLKKRLLGDKERATGLGFCIPKVCALGPVSSEPKGNALSCYLNRYWAQRVKKEDIALDASDVLLRMQTIGRRQPCSSGQYRRSTTV